MTDHPPKPQLTLRVGITGHRPNKLTSADLPRIEQQLRDTFATIEVAVAKAYEANKEVYASGPAGGDQTLSHPPDLRLRGGRRPDGGRRLSGRLDGRRRCAPFPKDEYLKDFMQSAAGDGRDVRQEFETSLKRAAVVTEVPTPDAGSRDQGYVASGGFMLRQIDVLVAVWDGQEPKPGGTGAIAQEACEGSIPVIWIATDETPDCPDRVHPATTSRSDRPRRGANGPCRGRSIQSLRRLRPIRSVIGVRRAQRLDQFYAENWRPVSRPRRASTCTSDGPPTAAAAACDFPPSRSRRWKRISTNWSTTLPMRAR